jgi:hypothetical protein
MPNVIVELTREMHRVEQLYRNLHGAELENARRTVAAATAALTSNSLEAMKESIDDLRDITGEPRKPSKIF